MRNFYIVLVMLSLIGCNSINKKEGLQDIPKEYKLSVCKKKELLLLHPRIAITDSFLVVVSSEQDSICKVFNIYGEMDEVCKYGKIGQGPKEFIQPFLTYANGNTFGLNEINRQELAIIEIKNNRDKNITIHEKKRLKAKYNRQKGKFIPADYYFVQLDDKHYVSLLGTEDGRFFTLSDSTLTHIEKFGESPVEGELSAINARNRLTGKIAANQGKMVYAATNLPYLTLYEIKDEKMKKKWSNNYATTAYKVKNGDLLLDKDKAIGPTLDVKMDSKYIYVLYMDQLLSEYDYFDSTKSCSNKILIFNHSGDIVACLNLDCRIEGMAIFSKGLKLYGIAQEPDMSLVTFNLPAELY